MTVAKSLEIAVTPPTCAVAPAPRDHVVAQVVDQVVGRLATAGEVVGTDLDHVTPCAGGSAATWATPGRVLDALARARPVVAGRHTTTWQRAVEARPEALGEQVVGLAGGRGRRRCCPGRWRRGAATARGVARSGHDGDGAARRASAGGAARSDDQRAAGAARLLRLRARRGEALRCRRLSTRMPSKPSSAGSSVMAARTLSTTVRDVPMATPSRKRRPQRSMPGERDAHRAAREQHRPPGGVEGGDRRLLGIQAAQDALAVPGDDEQGVVDADAQTDQGRQQRRQVGDVHAVTEQDDAENRPCRCRRAPTASGSSIAKSEPKREEEHHRGRREADHLGESGGRFLHPLDRLAAQLDLQPVPFAPCAVSTTSCTSSLGTPFASSV